MIYRRTRPALFTAGIAVAMLAAACGSSASKPSTASAGGTGGSVSATGTGAACGQAPVGAAPADAAKILASTPSSTQQLYAGDSNAVLASAWASWKPTHAGPYTVGVSFNALVNPFNAGLYKTLIGMLKSNPAVANVVSYTAANPSDVAGQIQQMQSLIQQKVDVILVLATSGSTAEPVVKQAAAANIPLISLTNYVNSPQAINVVPNTFQNVTVPAASILTQIGKKGNVLIVHGIPGTQTDVDESAYFKQLIKACPDVKLAGEVNGLYNPSVVKSQVLQFLATHPTKIDAVFQTATMAPAVIQAFQSAGRPVPSVLDIGAQEGSVAYWHENKSSYKGGGTVSGVGSLATLATEVTTRLLAGQGPKGNTFIWQQPYLTADNVDSYYVPGSTTTTPGSIQSTPASYTTPATLDSLFSHPELKTS